MGLIWVFEGLLGWFLRGNWVLCARGGFYEVF